MIPSRKAQEVCLAVTNLAGPLSTLISRKSIEREVRTHPDIYTRICDMPLNQLRQLITKTMNQRFKVYHTGNGVRRNTFVWIIRDETEVMQRVRP